MQFAHKALHNTEHNMQRVLIVSCFICNDGVHVICCFICNDGVRVIYCFRCNCLRLRRAGRWRWRATSATGRGARTRARRGCTACGGRGGRVGAPGAGPGGGLPGAHPQPLSYLHRTEFLVRSICMIRIFVIIPMAKHSRFSTCFAPNVTSRRSLAQACSRKIEQR